MTAAEKALVLKEWERFLKGGLARKDFTKRLYEHLLLHCSFIAHYNIEGFYETYFGEDRQGTIRFLKMFDPKGDGRSAEIGMDYWLHGDYGDLNEAMLEVMGKYIRDLLRATETSERETDLAEAQRLLTKHNVKAVYVIPEGK